MTHTAGYSHLIAMGMVNALKRVGHSAQEIASGEEYLESLRETGRFLTFAGGGPLIGTRLREDRCCEHRSGSAHAHRGCA